MPTETPTTPILALSPGERAMLPVTQDDTLAVCETVQEQVNLLSIKTPPRYIKKRKGRGGKELDYIETNYVIARLNATFFFDWDVETTWQHIDMKERQVAVRVKLTVRFADNRTITKEAFGGSEVKYSKAGEIIDLADDLKAAESDALKKAASMLGIGWDVYSGIANREESLDDKDDFTDTPPQQKKLLPDDKDDFLTGIEDDPNAKPDYKTITLSLANGTSVMVDKFEALGYFAKVKEALGKDIYYAILTLQGYKHANEIPPNKVAEIYREYVKAWKSRQEPRQ